MLSVGPVAPGIPAVGNEPFDLTGDGVIDNADVDVWLADAALVNGHTSPYWRGDATLDGRVDGRDFGIWNQYKFTSTLRWDRGNFDGNSVTDGSDFGIWNSNKFTSSDRAVVTPEPGMVVICASRISDRRWRNELVTVIVAQGVPNSSSLTNLTAAGRKSSAPKTSSACSAQAQTNDSSLRSTSGSCVDPPRSSTAAEITSAPSHPYHTSPARCCAAGTAPQVSTTLCREVLAG
jgi:hypothetical protein